MNLEGKITPEQAKRIAEHQRNVERSSRRKQISNVNKRFRRTGKNNRGHVRRKDWTDEAYRPEDEHDFDPLERVMPRDEQDRRRMVEEAAFQTPARDDATDETAATPLGRQGLVISAAGLSAQVEMDGEQVDCTVRGLMTELDTGFLNPVAVGDRVLVAEDGSGGWVVETVLPRTTLLSRPDPILAPRQLVIAANVDQLLIVSSWREPDIWLELIDRYLIAAERNGILPVICINKADLIDDESEYHAALQPYVDLGCHILRTSAVTGVGVDELREGLEGSSTVVVGLSGTGKSSLLSAVQPDLQLRTSEISDFSGQGRHTTTRAQLLKLDGGGYVADTPGIREFGMAGLTLGELPAYFPEIDAVAAACRFSNCMHVTEPGCAVDAAAEEGLIPESRLHSYRLIWDELPV
ncbi:MAG: ribosome small subunit-dependent GTPase A [SAR202 cluster bacterium]|nr:ribosome small subunit-dependent GTPase A [SAR202 cluster bacterium]